MSGNGEREESSLSELYAQATAAHEELRKMSTKEVYESCLSKFRECQRRTETLGLFSWNEGVEDLSTRSLRYLSIEYFLGMTLSMKRAIGDERLTTLGESLEWLRSFLKRTLSYVGLLDEETRRLMKPSTESGPALREVKIARHRALASLRQITSMESPLSENVHDEDEWAREMAIAQVRIHSLEAQAEIESIQSEMELLRLMQLENGSLKPEAISSGPPPSPESPLTKPLKPFVLLGNRSQLREQVFRPGHNLPTMTIDEYLELERKKGGILASQVAKATEEEDEDRDEICERKTMKDRQFDLFKDANPRGWGNTRNLG